MDIEVNSPAKAFVGIGLIVLAADGGLSDGEVAMISESMKSLDIFEGDAGLAARQFLGEMIERSRDFLALTNRLNSEEALAFSEDTVAAVLVSAREVLSSEMRERAVLWAVDLAVADGFVQREAAMLDRLARDLDVNLQLVNQAIRSASRGNSC